MGLLHSLKESRFVRNLFGIGPLIFAIYFFIKAAKPAKEASELMEMDWHRVGDLLAAAVLLIVAIIAFAPTLAEWVTTPIRNWIDTIYTPNGGGEVTPELKPAWKLARKYVAEGRWEEAVEAFQRIITYYPAETDAYVEGREAARQTGDPELVEWFNEAARKRRSVPLGKPE